MKYEDCDALVRALKSAFENMVNKRTKEILEKDLQEGENGEYFVKYDRDSVNNGIGEMTVRQETIQDEDRAFEDSKENIICEILGYEETAIESLFENVDFNRALCKFLKGC